MHAAPIICVSGCKGRGDAKPRESIRWAAACASAALFCNGAQASGRHQHWKQVESLAPGKAIKIEIDRQPAEQCLVIAVDDATLTCEREANPDADWTPGENARIVVPRDSVRAVWVWDDVSGDRVLKRTGIGFAIGALACSQLGPAPAFICAGIGALIGLAASATTETAPRYPWPGMSPPAQREPRGNWQLKLVYRAPA